MGRCLIPCVPLASRTLAIQGTWGIENLSDLPKATDVTGSGVRRDFTCRMLSSAILFPRAQGLVVSGPGFTLP